MTDRYYWTLAEPPEAKLIEVVQGGMFSLCMERAFAPRGFPLTLTEADLPILNGMASCWMDVTVSPYVMLASAIRRFKKITVFVKHAESDDETL